MHAAIHVGLFALIQLPEAGAIYRQKCQCQLKRHSMNNTAISNDMKVYLRDITIKTTRPSLLQAYSAFTEKYHGVHKKLKKNNQEYNMVLHLGSEICA